MKQTLFEQNSGTYTQQGDYMLPDVKLPDQPEFELGVWANRRRQFLKQHHRIKYYNMLTHCTLYPHLAETELHAQKLFDVLVDQLSEKEGVTEKLKVENAEEWIRRMNSIRARATEMVNDELIYS